MKICLANLHEATAQQVFEHVATHLLNQGKRATDGASNTCRYRTHTGLKCAAGSLIADNEYQTQFEGWNWSVLVKEPYIPYKHKELIKALQRIHDHRSTTVWLKELTELADRYNLDSTFLENVTNNIREQE